MTASIRSFFSNRSILLQVGAVLILCQLLAHGLTIGFMFWRFERPDLLNATSVGTVQAIGLYEALNKATPEERDHVEAAITRAHPATLLLEPEGALLAVPASAFADQMYKSLKRARPEFIGKAMLLSGTKVGSDESLIALPLPDGRLFAFVPEVVDNRITFPRAVSALFISVLVVPLAFLSLWGLKMLTAPLRGLARSAERFSIDLDPTPLPVKGPAEIAKLATAFNAMKRRIRQLVDSRSRMLAAVSHDLRTPLTRLRLKTEAFAESEDKEKMLRDISTMNTMIGQALSYLRDQTAGAARERVDLPALLESICSDYEDIGRSASFVGPRNVVLDCEPELLTRAVSNLVDNAIKFGGSAKISLEMRSPAEALIRIEDNGPGIPDEYKFLAFEPFSRGDQARGAPETEGFGLGLAIAKQIIERHGGQITLHDREPHGLSVQVVLPIGSGRPTSIPEIEASVPPRFASTPSGAR